MQQPFSRHQSRRCHAAPRLRAKIAGKMFLLALVAAGPAMAQSGAVVGSTLDPQNSNDSLMPAGGFRLDGPSDAPRDGGYNSLLMPGNAGFGLQIYGSYNIDQPQPNEPQPEGASASALPAAAP